MCIYIYNKWIVKLLQLKLNSFLDKEKWLKNVIKEHKI